MDILKETLDEIWKQLLQIRPYAGAAFLEDNEPDMNLWKGQYLALERMRKFIEEKQLIQIGKEEGLFSDHVKSQMATLLPHDHHLLDEIAKGLQEEGWIEEGGSPTYRLLHKQGAAIKIFRDVEAPQVIKICFSAEPEDEPKEPEVDKGTHGSLGGGR